MANTNHDAAYDITWLVRRLFRSMGQAADGYLADFGVTAADRAVMEFLYPEQPLTVPAIATRYEVSRQHVQMTVNRLFDRGLLQRRDNPKHKRSPLIELTRPGRTCFDEIRRHETSILEEWFAGIAADSLSVTRTVLRQLLANLNGGNG